MYKHIIALCFRLIGYFRTASSPRTVLLCAFSLLLTACDSSGGGNWHPPAGGDAPATYKVGGSIAGLSASGLILRNNGGDDLPLDAGATAFQFANPLAAGGAYNVTVLQQPAGQLCTVGNGTGTEIAANVSNVSVVCSDITHTVGGTISGLTTTGLVLQNNGGDALPLNPGDTSFHFSTPIAHDGAYNVTVQAQPVGLVCTVGNGSGSHVTANVGNVSVVCNAATFSIGGAVSGLAANGLVLRNNGADDLPVSSGATSFQFATDIAYGGSYNVTVQTQPVGETCTVSNASGSGITSSVNNIGIVCSPDTYSIGGNINGLSNSGLVLRNNGADDLPVTSGSLTFQFATPVAYNGSYNVSVLSQPATQTCAVSNGSGSGVVANVTNVGISCATNTYTVGGTISGLVGTLVLQNNGGDNNLSSADGAFTFATPVAEGATYNITVFTQPPGQTCTVSNGSGTIGSSNVTNVSITCSFPIPTISSATPNAGPTTGGVSVTITGTGFTNTSAVYFGASTATFVVNSDTSLTAMAPAGAAGSVDISVVTAGGSATLTNAYTYVP